MPSWLGGACALFSAAGWALSSAWLVRPVRRYGGRAINVYKSVVAAGLFLVTSAAVLGVEPFAKAGPALPWFALSGFIGLSIGDTGYYAALRHVGPTLSLILHQTSTVFAFLFGLLLRDERPTSLQIGGAACVAGGVIWATLGKPSEHAQGGRFAVGVFGGLVSGVCQAAGVILTQIAFDLVRPKDAPTDLPTALLAGTVRMAAAVAGLACAAVALRELPEDLRPLREKEGWRTVFWPAVLGSFLCMATMQVAVANLTAGVSTTLLATSPIFMIPVARLVLGEPITPRAVTGALAAVAGVVMLSVPAPPS